MSIISFLLLFQVAPAIPDPEVVLHWENQCTHDGAHCWLEKLVEFTGPQRMDRGGVAVSYDNLASKPMYVTVFLPPDTDRSKEVLVHFLDTVPDGRSWKLESAPTGMMSLPIMDCDAQFCSARVRPQIDNGNGKSTDFFAELKNRHFLWVLFIRNGKPERFMVPVSGVVDALREVALRRDDRSADTNPKKESPAIR